MKKDTTVPLHRANVEIVTNSTLTDGHIYKLKGSRRVEVWKIKQNGGLCIRIFRPTNDGKTSKLSFGLTIDAAAALAAGLSQHLPHHPAFAPG